MHQGYEAIKNKKMRLNRYEIVRILGSKQIKISASSVYNILKRNGLNRLKNMENIPKKVNNNKIIMSKSGELVHIDLHHLASSITIVNNNKPFYLLGLLDGYSRIAWVEVLESKKALDVMLGFLVYYNEHRPHTSLENLTPKEFIENEKKM